jgi:hypothetical protein
VVSTLSPPQQTLAQPALTPPTATLICGLKQHPEIDL